MKKNIILLLLLLFSGIYTEAFAQERKTSAGYSQKDATVAIDAFHETFYNPEMKLYAINSDKKGRAAIWTQAIYWDMIMDAYKRTKSPKYRQLIDDIYQGGYEQYTGFDWRDKHEWFIYDDMMWWIISLARAYEITGDGKYLADASVGFFYVWQEAYDKERGGLWWNFIHDAKMACINYPTIVAAMTLYRVTGDVKYLDKAKDVYKWSREFLFDEKEGKVADNMRYNHLYSRSVNVAWVTQLYNQGTCIGSAVMLYTATGEEQYLKDAVLAADYVKERMCYADGILEFKTGIEQGIYAAIFAQYIALLIKEGKQPQYLDWLRHNINSAWNNRDKKRNITFKDAVKSCPEGTVEVYDASGCPALMQLIPIK